MKRAYAPLLTRYLRYFPCVVLLGPRQCGKTTLLTTLPKSWKRFDLERQSDFQVISRDTDLFLKLNPDKIAIDEAQLQPALFSSLRVAIDENRKSKGRFVLTGSSSPVLVKSISETLAGRVGTIQMAPFSCAETSGYITSPFASLILERASLRDFERLKSRLSLPHIHQYWWKGGYPEPFLSKDPLFSETWMSQYVQTYVQRDLARLFPGLNQVRYQTFIQMLASLSGTIVNYSDVGRFLGVSAPTVRDYFQIAHETFLWRNIPAYEKKAIKRIVKHPRGYMRDTGLLHHLLRIPDAQSLLHHPKMGHSWEGLAIEEIIRALHTSGLEFDVYYYRTGAGAEIDLILEGAFGLVPIEIKYSQTVNPRELIALNDFIRERKCSYGIVINNDESPRLYNEKIIGIPFSCL